MIRGRPLALARLAFGLLTIVAIVAQYAHRENPSAFYTTNFFSFFTNESNLLAAALLSYGAYRGLRRGEQESSSAYELLRGAAVIYMTITGVVFVLLLSGSSESVPWANAVVHYVMPVVIVLDWLIDPPRMRVTWRKALRWLIFPVVYFGYTLIRGAITGWYPYPFLNVAAKGYGQVLADGAGILIGMIAVGSATLLAGNRLRERRVAPTS
ncbi:MAG: Pr6Pr family membrane protein [Solirubrobacterales bacterium]